MSSLPLAVRASAANGNQFMPAISRQSSWSRSKRESVTHSSSECPPSNRMADSRIIRRWRHVATATYGAHVGVDRSHRDWNAGRKANLFGDGRTQLTRLVIRRNGLAFLAISREPRLDRCQRANAVRAVVDPNRELLSHGRVRKSLQSTGEGFCEAAAYQAPDVMESAPFRRDSSRQCRPDRPLRT